MVDWMTQVTYILQFKQRVLFHAISIMDRFFQNEPTSLKSEEIHLTGVTALIIAWKFDTQKTYTLEDLSQIIVHGKFSADEIAC